MVINNIIQNFLITASGVTNAHTMFGPNLAGTRGKTLQQNSDRVVMDYVDVPKDFLEFHKFLTLVADVIFLNGSPLLITMSPGIKFVSVKHITPSTAKKLRKYSYSSSYRPVPIYLWHAHIRAVVLHTLHRGQRHTIICTYFINYATFYPLPVPQPGSLPFYPLLYSS